MANEPPASMAKPGIATLSPGVQHRRVGFVETKPGAVSLAEPGLAATAVGEQPQYPEGWTAYAQWFEDPANIITSMTTTWTVPPAPKNDKTGNQLIYLFNGLQRSVSRKNPSGRYILQPVLAWGYSPDGGGLCWSVASWYFDHKNRGFKSPSVNVKEGNKLTGLIKMTEPPHDHSFNYSCEFVGIDNTTLRVVGIGQLTVPVVALECTGIRASDDYPNTPVTNMRAIEVTTYAGPIGLNFVPSDVTATGQYAEANNATGTVDLFYGRS